MNAFSSPSTYYLAWGIKHLYSTRDYYEAHDGDYWRVKKNETKVIYRIHLNPKLLDRFILKQKTETIDWPYGNELVPSDCVKAELTKYYELNDKGEYELSSQCGFFHCGARTEIVSVDSNGKRK